MVSLIFYPTTLAGGKCVVNFRACLCMLRLAIVPLHVVVRDGSDVT